MSTSLLTTQSQYDVWLNTENKILPTSVGVFDADRNPHSLIINFYSEDYALKQLNCFSMF